jgi:hypothetical protein
MATGKTDHCEGKYAMTITVDIRPEVQAELARQATAHGRAIEAYVASLLEDAVHLPASDTETRRQEERKNLVEVCAMVRGLTEDVDFSRDPSTGRPVDLS